MSNQTRPLEEVVKNDRYNENELSRRGEGGDFERGYRKGWNDALRHAEREATP